MSDFEFGNDGGLVGFGALFDRKGVRLRDHKDLLESSNINEWRRGVELDVVRTFARDIVIAKRSYDQIVGSGEGEVGKSDFAARRFRYSFSRDMINLLETLEPFLSAESLRIEKLRLRVDDQEVVEIPVGEDLFRILAAFPNFTSEEVLQDWERGAIDESVKEYVSRFCNTGFKGIELEI